MKTCELCNETVRESNYNRHIKRCKQGKRIYERKSGICKTCNQRKEAIVEHERKCNGKPIDVPKKVCQKCTRIISKSNILRHQRVCKTQHRIRRKNETMEESTQ
jgi:hypothetical protein